MELGAFLGCAEASWLRSWSAVGVNARPLHSSCPAHILTSLQPRHLRAEKSGRILASAFRRSCARVSTAAFRKLRFQSCVSKVASR